MDTFQAENSTKTRFASSKGSIRFWDIQWADG